MWEVIDNIDETNKEEDIGWFPQRLMRPLFYSKLNPYYNYSYFDLFNVLEKYLYLRTCCSMEMTLFVA